MSVPAVDPVEQLLSRLKGVRRSGSGWEARCPSHEDARASLTIGRGEDGRALVCCHADHGCTVASIARAVGLEVRDLFSGDVEDRPRAEGWEQRIVCAYPYVDEGGVLLFEVVRLAHPKDFRQRRPDGRGGWIWSVKGVRRVPYRLPAILEAARAGREVYVVEGEKDADRLVSHGLVASCNAGGAGKWGDELCEPFRGARVVVVGDHDEAGRRHTREVAGKLSRVSLEARILDLPGLPPHGDVSDWLDAGHSVEQLQRLARMAPLWPVEANEARTHGSRILPPPLTVRELLEIQEPEDAWIAEGLIPAGANVLVAAYPKSYKTFSCLELAVSAVAGVPFLGRFSVPRRHRVALVLMEGSAWRTRKRLERLCVGKGVALEALEGALFLWFRPPLRLSSAGAMAELAGDVQAYDLDLLVLDNWSYLSTGNSNDSDEVTPQLDALSRLRKDHPGLAVLLVHHARKSSPDGGSERLTDVIRNSSAFGAWYDVGLVLARSGETSPVTVRVELRDHPSPEPFAFTVEDQFPAGPEQGMEPGGWLRLEVSARSPEQVQREAAAERFRPAVLEFLAANQGCSKRQLRDGLAGGNELVDGAFELLCREGAARFDPPARKGQAGRCWLMAPTVPVRAGAPAAHLDVVPDRADRAGTVPAAHLPDRADRAASPRRGVRPARSSAGPGLDRAAGWEEL